MNKKRLLKLASYLDTVDVRHFLMDHWIVEKERVASWARGKLKNKCGTVACALGHAGFIPSFRRAGLKTELRSLDSSGNVVYKKNANEEYYNGSAAIEFFSISYEVMNDIFYPENYPIGKRGPRAVAARIRKIVKMAR